MPIMTLTLLSNDKKINKIPIPKKIKPITKKHNEKDIPDIRHTIFITVSQRAKAPTPHN